MGGRRGKENVIYFTNLAVKDGWKAITEQYVKDYVESLQAQLIATIIDKFDKITLPLSGFKKLHLSLGRGKFAFDSEYRFAFVNGSSFDFKTQAIGAGGYNIQVYHFRYISDFLNANLADGTIIKNPSLQQIIEHFSDKQSLEKLTNPYLHVEAATTPDEIVEALYKWAKNNYRFTNVRKNSGKEDASLSYKPIGSMRYGSDGLYFKRTLPIETHREKAVKFLEENKAERPKFEKGGETPGEPKRLTLPTVNKAINAKFPGVYLIKGEGYFYIGSDDEDLSLKIAGLYNNNIPVNSLNQQKLEIWLSDVAEFMKEIDENEVNKKEWSHEKSPYRVVKKEDGGPVEKVKVSGYAKRIAENMRFMDSKLEEWRAVPIIGMDKTSDAKGNQVEVPVFDFPKGYKHAEGVFTSPNNAPYNCELCGKKPINTVYWIQNDEKKETLGVGSECVKFIGEGITGKDNLRQTKVNIAIMLDKDLSNLAAVIYKSHARKKSGSTTQREWGESYIGDGLPEVYEKISKVDHDLLFGKNQRNKDYIYWQKVWDSIPVFGYDYQITSAKQKGDALPDIEKQLLSWYSRNEKTAVPLMEQIIEVEEALDNPLIEGFHSDYLESKNKAAEPITFKKGGTINDHMKPTIASPAGGYLKGEENGKEIAHNDGSKGGILVGRRHKTGGIKAINKSNGQPIEVETGEVQIVADAVKVGDKKEFDGQQMTNKQILSTINEEGGGVAFAEKGMHILDGAGQPLVMTGGEVIITRNAVSSHDTHDFEGEKLTNRQILSRINESAGGVAFADGGQVPVRVKVNGKKYKYNGNEVPDYEIAHSCGCMHKAAGGPVSQKEFVKGYRIESKEHYDTFRKLRAKKITEEQALGEVVNEHLAENSKYYETYKSGGELPKTGKLKVSDIPATVKEFMPVMQQKAIAGSEEHWDILDKLYTIISEMPVTYQTQNIPEEEKVLWLHYFYGGSDWYIAEKDMEKEQLQAFGYVILNGDTENAEWGYISIEEIKETNEIELDFYFTPTKFGEMDFERKTRSTPTAAANTESIIVEEEDNKIFKQGQIGVSRIHFGFPDGTDKTFYNYAQANEGLKKIIKERKYGNVGYQIIFQDGEDISGSMDLEPSGSWDGMTEPFTWRVKYYWTNVVNDPKSKYYGYTEQTIEHVRNMLANYDFGSYTPSYNQPESKIISEQYATDPALLERFEKYVPIHPAFTSETIVPGKLAGEPFAPVQPPVTKQKSTNPSFGGKTQAQINTEIRELTDKNGIDRSKYSAEELGLLKLYEGAGGLAKHGETGARLFDQFFTPNDIVAKMWGLALKYGFNFNNSTICEPACGSGRFLQYIPKDANVNVIGYDVDKTSYTICKVLFPDFDIRHGSFESMFFSGRRHIGLAGVTQFFDLVITNPPYRDYVSEYAPLGEKDATGAFTMEMYFIMRGVDVLKSGGLLIMLIPNTFMSNDSKYNSFKEKLDMKADLIDAYRLPSGVFNNTSVGTDIIVLKKK